MPISSAISLRVSPNDRKLIDRAAQTLNKSRTEFMLDSARAAATDALLDKSLFMLDSRDFQTFEKALVRAPRSAELVRRLKERPAPWTK